MSHPSAGIPYACGKLYMIKRVSDAIAGRCRAIPLKDSVVVSTKEARLQMLNAL